MPDGLRRPSSTWAARPARARVEPGRRPWRRVYASPAAASPPPVSPRTSGRRYHAAARDRRRDAPVQSRADAGQVLGNPRFRADAWPDDRALRRQHRLCRVARPTRARSSFSIAAPASASSGCTWPVRAARCPRTCCSGIPTGTTFRAFRSSRPAFVPGNRLVIYGARDLDRSLRDVLAGQMHYTYFPVPLGELRAEIEFCELEEGEIQIDDAVVRTHYLNHTAVCMGYRIEADGVSVAYITDHEPYGVGGADERPARATRRPIHGGDRRLIEFVRGVDLLIQDAQYTPEEYAARRGWGHGSTDYVTDVAVEAGVRRVALFHHEPTHADDDIDRMVEYCRHAPATPAASRPLRRRRRQRNHALKHAASSTRTAEYVVSLDGFTYIPRAMKQFRAGRVVLRSVCEAMRALRHHHRSLRGDEGRPGLAPGPVLAASPSGTASRQHRCRAHTKLAQQWLRLSRRRSTRRAAARSSSARDCGSTAGCSGSTPARGNTAPCTVETARSTPGQCASLCDCRPR